MKPHSLLPASAAHARSPTKAVGSSEKAGSIAQAPDSLTNPHSPDAASRARHSGPSAAGFCGAAGSGSAASLPVGGGVSVSSAAVPFARSSSLLIPIAAPAHAMPADGEHAASHGNAPRHRFARSSGGFHRARGGDPLHACVRTTAAPPARKPQSTRAERAAPPAPSHLRFACPGFQPLCRRAPASG